MLMAFLQLKIHMFRRYNDEWAQCVWLYCSVHFLEYCTWALFHIWFFHDGTYSLMEYIFEVLLLFRRTFDQCECFNFVLQLFALGKCHELLRIGNTKITFCACNFQAIELNDVSSILFGFELNDLPTRIMGTLGEKCRISGNHFDSTLSKDVRLDIE